MTITFATGAYYAMWVPDIGLDEIHAALARGEVLLMADVPAGQVADIESFIRHHHPRCPRWGKLDHRSPGPLTTATCTTRWFVLNCLEQRSSRHLSLAMTMQNLQLPGW
ncbi:MAG: hypothetical protein V3R65_01550 [Acidiferrobacterales bacterium]